MKFEFAKLADYLKRVIRVLGLCLLLLLVVIVAANYWVIERAGPIQHDLAQLRAADVALVLGTSHWSAEGHPNRHFAGRIAAAVALYKAGKVRHILASGANPDIYYNEPQRMLEALTEQGVPASDITLDYAGRRTLDSVVRAQAVFGLNDLIIVSQPYHLYRAMYLARANGVRAQGFAAAQPVLSERWRLELREMMARVLAVLDLRLLGTQAGVLGNPEPIILLD